MRHLQWWEESALPGGDRVKVSENLGATWVAPVAPVDTSLQYVIKKWENFAIQILDIGIGKNMS